MKFRAVMVDTIPMREFTNIVTTLSKISKECILKLSSSKVYFIVSDDGTCGQAVPKVWAQLDQTSFFSEYHMEGVDEEHRDIYLGFNTGNFARSVATLKQTAKSIKMKLTNKQCPCLTLEIEIPSLNQLHTRQVTHDVPVSVAPRKSWKSYGEPSVEKYHVSIVMPSLKQIRSSIDRMKSMSPELIVKANSSGQLVLQIKTDMAVVSSRFRNLFVEHFDDGDKVVEDDEDQRDESYIMCRIDIKKFAMFLSADQITNSRVVCSMIHKKIINLFMEQEGVMSFQCFIPALCY